jgi:hypothetical protein
MPQFPCLIPLIIFYRINHFFLLLFIKSLATKKQKAADQDSAARVGGHASHPQTKSRRLEWSAALGVEFTG